MRINFPKEEDGFRMHPHKFCGKDAFLIIPEIDAKWTKDNLFYRSMIVDKKGNVLDCGYPKFFNASEKEDCYPDPTKFKDWIVQDKVDGSLLIATYCNDQFSMRTRGTASYLVQENAADFELLPQKYPKVVEFLKENSHLSLLFEIVTPNNIIVIRPKEVEFYLLGAINKNGLCVVTSHELTEIWRKIGCVQMPQSYQFDGVSDLKAIVKMVKDWKGKEGVVLSYNNNQNRIKLKSDWYCFVHKIKSQLNSENNLIEYYVDHQMPDYNTLYNLIETEFDFEIAKQLEEEIQKLVERGEKVKHTVESMKDFVTSIRNFETRKQQAEHIITSYGKANKASFVFSLLDGKELTREQLIKLFSLVQ